MTKAAQVLGVHPNTIRAWSDQGRLRYYRINDRGDRRYRLGDLRGFLAAAERRPPDLEGRRRRSPEAIHRGAARAAPVAPRQRRPIVTARPTTAPASSPPMADEQVRALGRLAGLVAATDGLAATLAGAVEALVGAAGHALAVALERRDGRLIVRAAAGEEARLLASIPDTTPILSEALATGRPAAGLAPVLPDGLPVALRVRRAAPIAGPTGDPWGVLVVADKAAGGRDWEQTRGTPAAIPAGAFLEAVAGQVSLAVETDRLRNESEDQVHRAEALRRIAHDISSQLDLDRILASVVDHARVLFAGDRAGVFLRGSDGSVATAVTRGLSDRYLAAVRSFPVPSLPAEAMALGRPQFAQHYRDDPRAADFRAAVVQEGYDTICATSLGDGEGALGVLVAYHDRPHDWTADELDTLDAFAAQAAAAIRNAQRYARMVTWAAQLQSIQQLGARLSRLGSSAEVGQAIATELQALIDYHSVRVYRLMGEDDLIPVAMKGQIGEYVDETVDQLRVKVGEGITGWVAANNLPQYLPDASIDPRTVTVPGTETDFDESMLLAPMAYEDQVVGVIVLSKLGLNQFTDDDLRLLVIYASLAAQAMANADAAERLRLQSAALQRQIQSQRALLRVSEEIVGTLDAGRVLDEVTENLSELVRWDNISIELWNPDARMLQPLVARGVHAAEYLQQWQPGEEGLATWVVHHGEAQLVPDQLADPRVVQFELTGPLDGSLIVVPLRGRDGVIGVLTVERLGPYDRFTADDFDLVQLFAAQVSIALQNAEAHRQVVVRAETDPLTGLLHRGTFQQWLVRSVAAGERFGLLMLDLDGFKEVNDTVGHQAGDIMLRAVAEAILGARREGDRVFRYGGDEFTVLLPGSDAAGAAAAAGRIRSAVRQLPVPAAMGRYWHVSASVGIANFPADGTTADAILLSADRACFVAKRAGRNGVATAEEARAFAGEFALSDPTPVDPMFGPPESPAA